MTLQSVAAQRSVTGSSERPCAHLISRIEPPPSRRADRALSGSDAACCAFGAAENACTHASLRVGAIKHAVQAAWQKCPRKAAFSLLHCIRPQGLSSERVAHWSHVIQTIMRKCRPGHVDTKKKVD